MVTTRARLVVALVASCSLSAGSLQAVDAQTEEPAVELRLLDQPLWHDPSDPLDLTLEVANSSGEPIEGFLLRIEGHPRVSSRSALHATFEGDPGLSISSFPKYYSEVEVPAGQTHQVSVSEPVTDLAAIANAPGGGVFPVTVSLFDEGGSQLLDSITTPVIHYPSPPEIPLGISLVVPLNDLPSRAASGTYAIDATTGRVRLEDAISSNGWLNALLDTLLDVTSQPPAPEPPDRRGRGKKRDRRPRPKPTPPPMHLALAPTARFLEELADLTDGYPRGREVRRRDSADARAAAAAIGQLRDLVRRRAVQTLLVPYAFPDLPTLVENLPLEDGLIPQLAHAGQVMSRVLGVEVRRDWLFPPAGRLDSATLQDLKTIEPDLRHFVLSDESFPLPPDTDPPGCPTDSPSFVCPVAIPGARNSNGLLTDPGLQDRFADLIQTHEKRLGLQNFFAETAMIREEAPGVSGRIVQATVPSLWHPEKAMVEALLKGLHDAPWLRTLTPREALQRSVDPGPRRLAPSLADLAVGELPDELFDAIATTQQLVDSFRLVRPPPALTQRLVRNLLVAQSRMWGASALLSERANDYVAQTLRETRSELGKITVGGTDEIRLTSRRGEIPLEVFNETEYAVSVIVEVVSPDLRLDETTPLVLQPGRFQQITVDIAARSSGIFPVEVAVVTPDGSYEIDTKSITIRSTEFNQVALVITLGALAFLVLFYLLPRLRRRQPEAQSS